MADVRLVDLEVIKRFSLAVRQDTASAEEVLAALDASRTVVLAALGRGAASQQPAPRARATAGAKPAKRASPAKPAVRTRRRPGGAGSE